MEADNIVNNHYAIHKSTSLLDSLLEFEKALDEMGLYTYKNWNKGEIVEGPKISRYWIETTLMYPLKEMPDPTGGQRLLGYDCKVTYKKDSYNAPRRVKSYDDYQPGTKKPKVDEVPVWLVNIKMPKKFLENFGLEHEADATDQSVADQEALQQGQEEGLNDEALLTDQE
tara:strand:+ start:1474 stop:1983 length:510 start_codon:yes stop_codon:yes gene_type:complete